MRSLASYVVLVSYIYPHVSPCGGSSLFIHTRRLFWLHTTRIARGGEGASGAFRTYLVQVNRFIGVSMAAKMATQTQSLQLRSALP